MQRMHIGACLSSIMDSLIDKEIKTIESAGRSAGEMQCKNASSEKTRLTTVAPKPPIRVFIESRDQTAAW
jgi:hypothetical protein